MENSNRWPEMAVRLRGVAEHCDRLAAAAKRAHAIVDLPDAIIEAVRLAKMDRRHNHLNRLLELNPARQEHRGRK
jgi:hypothetical protein